MSGERVRDGCHPGHPDVRQPVSLLMGHCRRQDWRQGKGGHTYGVHFLKFNIDSWDTEPLHAVPTEPPGSRCVSQRYGSGSFHHKAKILRKTFISTVLSLCDFFMTFIFEE
jgi:hypothetical protein